MQDFLTSIFYAGAYLVLPVAILIWFIVSLILFLRTPKDAPERREKRRMLVISGIFCLILVGLIAALMIVLMIGVAHM